MGWTNCHTGMDFLSHINTWCRVVDGEVELVPRDELRGQKTLGLYEAKRFAFSHPVDLVIEAECSTAIEADASPSAPMLECIPDADRPNDPPQSWLHYVIDERKPKSVLVYAQCCGAFSDQYIAMVQEIFPKANWHFPDVRDFCDNVHNKPEKLCEDLLEDGILIAK